MTLEQRPECSEGVKHANNWRISLCRQREQHVQMSHSESMLSGILESAFLMLSGVASVADSVNHTFSSKGSN